MRVICHRSHVRELRFIDDGATVRVVLRAVDAATAPLIPGAYCRPPCRLQLNASTIRRIGGVLGVFEGGMVRECVGRVLGVFRGSLVGVWGVFMGCSGSV